MTTMQLELIDGKVTLSLWDAIAAMTGDERASLIDALACRDDVIDEVMNQVIEGLTSAGSRAGKSLASHTTYGGLDSAVRRVAKAASEVAAKEIERLESALKREEAQRNVGWNAYHELLRSREGRF